MSWRCYHPKFAYDTGKINPDTGKRVLKFMRPSDVNIDRFGNVGVYIYDPDRNLELAAHGDFLEIPCGECLACRMAKAQDWAGRLMLELESHDSAYFLTLTYDDEHCPISGNAYTLVKYELQLFFKRLRRAFPNDHIRYLACGEYGDTTFRPHYHAIVFGLHLDDLVPFGRSGLHDVYYASKKLQSVWSSRGVNGKEKPIPFGFITIGAVTWNSCAYVARYVLKKQQDQLDLYDELGIERPFIVMSRKPGIAKGYYDTHNVFDYEYINITTNSKGKKISPPAYFRRLLELDDPERAQALKDRNRRLALDAKRLKLEQTDLPYLELLSVEEAVHSSRIKKLKRSYEENA